MDGETMNHVFFRVGGWQFCLWQRDGDFDHFVVVDVERNAIVDRGESADLVGVLARLAAGMN